MPELLELAQRLAGEARPGEQVEAYVAWYRETDVRAYEGEIESLSASETAGVGVRVIADHRQGFAYVGNLDIDLALGALDEARDNAGFASPDENLGLAVPDGVVPAELALWDDALEGVSTDEKLALAVDLDRRVRSADSRIRKVIGSDYSDTASESAIATSTGISSTARRTTCFVSSHLVAGEGEDSQTGGSFSGGRGPGSLDLDYVARDAAERATRLLGATKPKGATVEVVFDPRVTATLLGLLGRVLSGEEVVKGRSLFAGRLGEMVGSPTIDLVEDPTNPLAFGAARVDAEGLACRPTALIEAGRLSGFLYDTYSARRVGAVSTASAARAGFKSTPGVGARALRLHPGSRSAQEVISQVGSGLYVQSVIGLHSGVNLVSGDFSVGAEGLLIENGELGRPVREITIASSIQRMLSRVIEIGADIEWLPGGAAGVTLALGGISMSGA